MSEMKSVLSGEHSMMIREAKKAGTGRIWILELLVFVLVFLVGSLIESLPITLVTIVEVFKNPSAIGSIQSGDVNAFSSMTADISANMPESIQLASLFCTVLMTVTAIIYCRSIEGRKMNTMGFTGRGAIREYLIGAVIGIVMISAAVLGGVLTGTMKLSFAGTGAGIWLLYLLGYFFQGMSEETLCRGYLMISASRKNSVLLSLILSSLAFSALHFANPGFGFLPFVNIFICGMTFGLYILKRDNIWGASAMHSFWNLFQGNVFGISVSGTGLSSSVFSCVQADGRELLTGGEFGIEGGILVTIVEIAAFLFVLFMVPEKKSIDTADESLEVRDNLVS